MRRPTCLDLPSPLSHSRLSLYTLSCAQPAAARAQTMKRATHRTHICIAVVAHSRVAPRRAAGRGHPPLLPHCNHPESSPRSAAATADLRIYMATD
eukprot:scaffold85125_cov39-Tisochrysis_lutea.AAC.2